MQRPYRFQQNAALYGESGPAPIFEAPLTHSLALALGTGSPTFTRATTATVMGYAAGANAGADQTLLTVAANEARLQGARRVSEGVWSNLYADGSAISAATLQGYLAEGQRTNLALRSQEFDNASWTKGTSSAADGDQTTSPDGTLTADKFRATATEAFGVEIYQVVTFSDTTYTLSAFVHPGTAGWCYLQLGGATANAVRKSFNLSTGVVGASQTFGTGWAITSFSIEAAANGFYRVTLSGATPAGANRIVIGLANADSGASITSGQYVYAWGAQLEAFAFASSYIPTTSAAVTRNVDVLTYPTSGNYQTAQGTIFANGSIPYGCNPNGSVIVGVGNAPYSFNNYLTGFGKVISGDSTSNVQVLNDTAFGASAKAAVAFSGASRKVYLNGTSASGAFDGSMGSGSVITIGGDSLDTVNYSMYGTLKNVKIFDSALSDAAVAAL